MKCPECKASRIYVVYTRQDTPSTILRYRRCQICSHRWFTLESKVEAKFHWSPDAKSRIPKTLIRDAVTPAEKEAGILTVTVRP